MPRLRRLSGADTIDVFVRMGFSVVRQKGSHVKLRRVSPNGEVQTLTIPKHKEMDTGTLRAILRQATRYIPEEELREFFYTE
ncbi:MAG TPA: type II toxin-antitoxin system HicA family toxin [Anaerolineae bacterium]|nr:type II toxin-antitoxin system HicA family toxin [Anaerolineae bacterium]